MSGAHTPGPWFVTETDGIWVEVAKPYGSTAIAPICNYVGPIQRAANARLIVAAPELLEALEAALPIIKRERDSLFDAHTSGGDPATLDWMAKPDVDEMDGIMNAAIAVIAKARGQ